MTEDDGKNELGTKGMPTWLKVLTGAVVPIVLALIVFFGDVLVVAIPEVFDLLSSGERDANQDETSDEEGSSDATAGQQPALPPIQNLLDEPSPDKPARTRELPPRLPAHVRMAKTRFSGAGQSFQASSAGQFLALTAVDAAGRSSAHDFRLESVSDGSAIPPLRSNQTPPSAKLFVLPDLGWYRLHLADGAADQGEVILHLFSPEASATPRTLRPDAAVRGKINDVMEVDFYSVPVSKDDRLLVLFRVTEYVGLISVELFSSERSLASNDLMVGGVQQVTVGTNGRLTLAVFGRDQGAPVPYEVYVKKLPDPILLKGEEAEFGQIGFIGDSRKYLLNAAEGSQWWIDLHCHDDLEMGVQIQDPEAHILKGAICATDSPFKTDIEARRGGEHAIVVEGIQGSTGTFTLTVRELRGGQRVDADPGP